MKAREFIEEYLSSCDDNIVCLHSPHEYSGITFTIHDWRTGRTDKPISEWDSEWGLECEISQIRAEVENYRYNLAVVIHIYTEYPCEEAR